MRTLTIPRNALLALLAVATAFQPHSAVAADPCSVHPLSRQCRRRKSGELSGTAFACYAAFSTAAPSFSARYSAGVFHPSA